MPLADEERYSTKRQEMGGRRATQALPLHSVHSKFRQSRGEKMSAIFTTVYGAVKMRLVFHP